MFGTCSLEGFRLFTSPMSLYPHLVGVASSTSFIEDHSIPLFSIYTTQCAVRARFFDMNSKWEDSWVDYEQVDRVVCAIMQHVTSSLTRRLAPIMASPRLCCVLVSFLGYLPNSTPLLYHTFVMPSLIFRGCLTIGVQM